MKKQETELKIVTREILAFHHGTMPVQVFEVKKRGWLRWRKPFFLVLLGGVMTQMTFSTLKEAVEAVAEAAMKVIKLDPNKVFVMNVNNLKHYNKENLETLLDTTLDGYFLLSKLGYYD